MPRRSCSALAAPPSCVNLPVERRGSRKAAPSGRSNTKTLAFRPPDYSKTLVILTEKKHEKTASCTALLCWLWRRSAQSDQRRRQLQPDEDGRQDKCFSFCILASCNTEINKVRLLSRLNSKK